MLKSIDHIGIAVSNLSEVKQMYASLFSQVPDFEEVKKKKKVKVLGFHIGNSHVEYLEPTDDSSPIAKFLTKKGSGIHHIAYHVENLEETLKKSEELGIVLIDKVPRNGANGKKIAFIHPKSTNGILIELVENN